MKQSNCQLDSSETEIIINQLKAVLANNVNGDVVEFGCYDGATSIQLAKAISGSGRKLYVYDSFEGLPAKTNNDISPVGEQFQPGELLVSKKQFIKNIQKANVCMPIIKKGWFCDLSNADVPARICFAFLDGDYYESIIDSFKLIEGNLSSGAVIVVDDYMNDALPGAKKAVDGWLSQKKYRMSVKNSLAIINVL